MKLWQKDYELDKEIEKFTVGNDYLLDYTLIKFDCIGSIAHAAMLHKIGILSKKELEKLKKALLEILNLDKKGKFTIKQEDEDVHTAIENWLTEKLGILGSKVHAARSRNDMVLLDVRLYSKEKLIETQKSLAFLIGTLLDFAGKNKNVPMPGFTHARKAMPSSVGLLFGAYAESLMDNFKLLDAAYELNDQNPLGSAAGYGINLDIDRDLATKLLGFKKTQNNVLYVQNSRGKIESSIVFALSKIMQDLERMSNDLIMFSMESFGFFSLPGEFTTGSSIMPQKKNPDVFELLRAKSSSVHAALFEIDMISKKLLSGYNRDLQLIKEPLIKSFDITLSSIKIMDLTVKALKVSKDRCIEACTSELFATDKVAEMIAQGIPMREAYKKVAGSLEELKGADAVSNIIRKTHVGAPGNLGLGRLKNSLAAIDKQVKKEEGIFNSAIKKLLK